MSIKDFDTSPHMTPIRASGGPFNIAPIDPSPAPEDQGTWFAGLRQGRIDGQRTGRALLLAEILGPNATEADARELAEHLRRVHDGTDREGLLALLQRLWGVTYERPVSDLKGLAARECQPAVTQAREAACEKGCGRPARAFGVCLGFVQKGVCG